MNTNTPTTIAAGRPRPPTLHSATPRGRPRRRRRVARWALWSLAVVLVLAVIGASAQLLLEGRDARAYPAQGELVDVGGRSLHLHVTGERPEGPTVVMEAGLGAPSVSWAWVQPAVDDHATVVSYDRAGIGWSDSPAEDRGPAAAVEDLRAALEARGLPGPYVLVAHSMGAFVARSFAGTYPDDVAALVLVDPSHEEQHDEYPDDERADIEGAPGTLRALSVAARFGALRIHNPQRGLVDGTPEHARGSFLAWMSTPESLSVMADELEAFDSYGQAAADAELRDDLPVTIISADTGMEPGTQWMTDNQLEQHRKLQQLTGDTHHSVLPGATHYSVLTDRRYAEQVAEHIVQNVGDLRASPATGTAGN